VAYVALSGGEDKPMRTDQSNPAQSAEERGEEATDSLDESGDSGGDSADEAWICVHYTTETARLIGHTEG
jgi:hypothetical protein